MNCKEKKTRAEVALLKVPKKLADASAKSNRACTGQCEGCPNKQKYQ